ncbi:hypothetical protein IAT38_008436 [Cryptococcus sp. DSM 104549]
MVKDSSLIGKPAPPLELPSIPDGTPYKLPLGEKPIALFFFPAAGTMGCTREACGFRDAQAQNVVFKRNTDLVVVGISEDPTAKQASFADQYKLPYPILCDEKHEAIKAYGVGRQFLGLSAGRETFFIDGKGIVRAVCDKSIDIPGHVKFVEEQLIALEKENSS